MDFLLQSFEENTILWILLSAGLGGVIGSTIKFIFDHIWAPKLKQSRDAKNAIRLYTLPLLRIGYSLDRRIENLITFVDKQWFDDKNDDYYRLSTLYLLGSYFGLCKIIENKAFIEFEKSHKKTEEFNISFYNVFKGITSYYYFKDIKESEITSTHTATVPRFALTAIGELMIEQTEENNKNIPNIISFVKFSKQYKTSSDFKKWFVYLENLLSKLQKSQNNAKWNRLIVFAINLRAFITHLDPKGKYTKPREITYLAFLHQKIAERIMKDLEKSDLFKKNILRIKTQ